MDDVKMLTETAKSFPFENLRDVAAGRGGAGGSRVHDDLTVSFVVTANTTIAR